MTSIYVALEQALAIVKQQQGEWTVDLQLVGSQPQCLAIDPLHPERIYGGTFNQGLWRSMDEGRTFESTGSGITRQQVMSLAVDGSTREHGYGTVYVGTEPSAIYRSEDGGTTFRELEALRALPSAASWSFPPRPWTSHIRWITLDPLQPAHIYAAAEAGALVQSVDGGEHWEDRRPDGPFDTHTLAMHRLAPGRLYSAAGDGFMRPGNGFVQSDDGGASWFRPDDGLTLHYLWSMAVDPTDPETLVVSACPGPRQAHTLETAESALFRRSKGSPFQQVSEGLPAQQGTLASVLASHEAEPGVFYAANNHGVYRSADTGLTWEALPIPWPAGTLLGHVNALIVRAD